MRKSLPIRLLLPASYFVISVVAGTFAILSWRAGEEIRASAAQLVEHDLAMQRAATELSDVLNVITLRIMGVMTEVYIPADSATVIARSFKLLSDHWLSLSRLANSATDPTVADAATNMWPGIESAVGHQAKILAAIRGAGSDAAVLRPTMQAWVEASYPLRRSLTKFQHTINASAQASKAVAESNVDAGIRIAVIAFVACVGVGVLGIHFVVRHVTRPLARATETLSQLALGNREIQIKLPNRNDEMRALFDAVLNYRDSLIRVDRLAAEINAERQHLDAALNNMSQGLAMFDREQRLIISNERYARLYGLSLEQVKPGTPLSQIVEDRIARGIFAFDNPEQYRRERLTPVTAASHHVYEMSDGRAIAVMREPMLNGGWVATHEDITERRRVEAQIVHLAHHDVLTDLPNRALLRQRLDEELDGVRRGGRSLSMLMLDLDRFKDVNDTLGHPIGDALLKAVTERLRGCVRETDTIARLGGDEFAIVQKVMEPDSETVVLAKRIQEAISASFDIDGHHVVIGVSTGVAVAPGDGTDPDQLIKNADLALYRAKSEGRGTYRFFEPEMDRRMQERRGLERDLRNALVKGELVLHYQPLVNIERDEICGFEALLRWQHPVRGRLPPSEFIPLAEDTGLIVPIGEWVLRQACSEAANWPGHLKIAVNVSPAQFKSGKLVEVVVNTLATTGMAAHRLELEITESVMLDDEHVAHDALTHLHNLGVRLALDDFGTGYSSLSNLRKFPFDKIKIDRSFVSDLSEANVDALAVVRSLAQLGVSLGIATTAEGVETKEQVEHVRVEGCTEMQGYYICRPSPASDIEALILDQCSKSVRAA